MAAKLVRPRRLRVETEVPGLDRVLGGGLLRGGIYVVRGAPGSGKTILGNQVCFANARRGGRSAYVTLLAESHARMMLHLESLDFFDPGLVEGRVDYLSGYGALVNAGLRGVLDFIRSSLSARSPGLRAARRAPHADVFIVIDGFIAVSEASSSVTDVKKFIHELQLYADLAGATVLLLAGPAESEARPEYTMVDGIIELSELVHELRGYRELRVRKLRGVGHLNGGHFVTISNAGMTVHPRTEALYVDPPGEEPPSGEPLATGVPGLDELLGGGIPERTSTLLVGPCGSGKTTLGLQFLAAAKKTETSVFFGFYETPTRLLDRARQLGLPLATRATRGSLEIVWQPSTERNVDQLVHRLLEAVDRTGASRLVVDGIDGFERAAVHPHRVHHIFSALGNELRRRGVTTMYTFESSQLVGPSHQAPLNGVSALAENLIVLRFVEVGSRLHRLLSVHKLRDRAHDTSLRELHTTDRGLRVERTADSADTILRGAERRM